MANLKEQLRSDLTASMKARDAVRSGTIRMLLTAVTNAEVAGETARQLTDDELLAVVTKESKKRREAAEVYEQAGRTELADKERAEDEILRAYLPAALSADELAAIVRDAIAETGAAGMKDMGKVMKVVQPKVRGRADGAEVAAEVRRNLG